jgi:hypothetical protein
MRPSASIVLLAEPGCLCRRLLEQRAGAPCWVKLVWNELAAGFCLRFLEPWVQPPSDTSAGFHEVPSFAEPLIVY